MYGTYFVQTDAFLSLHVLNYEQNNEKKLFYELSVALLVLSLPFNAGIKSLRATLPAEIFYW
jgi:hypothetical protein